jgi:quinol monooxygenase YgiN
MRTIMVRYKTSAEAGDANAALVRAVFDELRRRAPGGIRYASYRLADNVTFVHIATVAVPQDNPLTSLPSFKAFQSQLKDRCVEPPVVTEVSIVGAYPEAAP